MKNAATATRLGLHWFLVVEFRTGQLSAPSQVPRAAGSFCLGVVPQSAMYMHMPLQQRRTKGKVATPAAAIWTAPRPILLDPGQVSSSAEYAALNMRPCVSAVLCRSQDMLQAWRPCRENNEAAGDGRDQLAPPTSSSFRPSGQRPQTPSRQGSWWCASRSLPDKQGSVCAASRHQKPRGAASPSLLIAQGFLAKTTSVLLAAAFILSSSRHLVSGIHTP
jgi:hypothetical protein